ncbi:magnesium transporter [Sphingomonas ginkgonis]|uniref:Magnesium transporter MgtE n=1 Tax=Sphingomonas ginkgonis TaxID=2315330 RepID=A0A3R9YKI9_9SPHN|nr:magnesium transporter [Sphingomonas ginkgonis]RST29628.1 magnesium transporter [Sphingomonas ginkgonis]
MSELERVATATPDDNVAVAPPEVDLIHDSDDRLRPEFVSEVLDLVEAGDNEAARARVAPLHPADVADLIELARVDERDGLVAALAGIVDADVVAELNDYVRETLIDEMAPEQVADLAGQLDTDDAVAILEDLEEDEQRAVLRAMEPDDRAAIEEALTYPEESAGRLMQRELIAVPEHWDVGQVIDYLRSGEQLADDFWEVFVVGPRHHPVGTCKLSAILRTRREVPVAEIMAREQTLIPVDMDQEDVALRFQKYALVSAAVVDKSGRLVGMITVDDIVHIIQEEAGEDVLLLSGAGDGDINEPVRFAVRTRLTWLIINLGTAIVAASVVGLFQGEISRLALLAVLMPIVSGMGGNAGTQTLAVVVRALATNQLTSSNTVRMIARELKIALANGLSLGLLIGTGVALVYANPLLGSVMGTAMIINNLVAGLAGIMVPVALDRMKIDPAVSSAVFVTMATDVMGFFSFLGLAALVGLGS